MIYDIRSREVPMGLTITGMAGAGIYALFNGIWAPVVLMLALIIISDLHTRRKRIGIAILVTVVAVIFQPAVGGTGVAILGVWILWEMGVMGGADGKLLMTILLLTGNPAILIPVAIAGGIQGGIASIRKQKDIPFVVSIFCGTLFFVVYSLI